MKKIGIVMGSDSDLPVVEKAMATLEKFGVPFEAHVYSAHRTPVEASEFAKGARENGFGAIIAAAGKAAHLAGAMAANTTLPVIGIPIKSSTLDGLDALLSTVQMPSGLPVATVAIDGAENAALLAIQILGVEDAELAAKLDAARAEAAAKKALAEALLAQGEAEAAAAKARGLAEAEAIRAKADAEAEGLLKKAEAMKQYGEAAKMDMQMEVLKLYFEQLPAIAQAVGEGYNGVEKIVMLGNDSGQLAGNMMSGITQITEGFKGATGMDLNSIIGGMLGAKIADNQ